MKSYEGVLLKIVRVKKEDLSMVSQALGVVPPLTSFVSQTIFSDTAASISSLSSETLPTF